MMTLNHFIAHYKTISNTDLINILDNKDEYQPAAIEAANQEFLNRKLSDTDIEQARQPLLARKAELEKKNAQLKSVETKIKSAGNTLFEDINPMQSEAPSAEKTIRLMVIFFTGYCLFHFISNFRLILSFVLDLPRNPVASFLYLFPHLFLCFAIYLFWKRKRMGWILTAIFLTYTSILSIGLFVTNLIYVPRISALSFSIADPIVYIFSSLFLFASIYIMVKPAVRAIFSIDERKMITTIGVSGIITLIFMLITA